MGTLTYAELARSDRSRLEQLLVEGKGPSLASLAGWEFRGFNVLAPHEKAVMWVMSNTRFIKCFFLPPGSPPDDNPAMLHGYNLKVRNGGVDDAWTTIPDEACPKRIGHYRVHATRNRPGHNRYPGAVFFDYAQPENNLFTGSTIDDYMVQPDPQNPDLLLGKAFTRLGIMTPSTFFVLERLQRHAR